MIPHQQRAADGVGRGERHRLADRSFGALTPLSLRVTRRPAIRDVSRAIA
jgi:hypothetical protein